jgi:hypothetical protein
VEHLWIAGHHIDWQTGLPNDDTARAGIKTHCSAFAAEACNKLNIYLLRPPQHGQVLLANAQFKWLKTDEARKDGWQPITGADVFTEAQRYTNLGYVVIAVCKNPITSKPGHIALIMPCTMAFTDLTQNGPDCIMAGTHNYNDISLRKGFKSHITTWPEPGIVFYRNVSLLAP